MLETVGSKLTISCSDKCVSQHIVRRPNIRRLHTKHTMSRILLEDKVFVPDVDDHPAAVESKIHGAGLIAPRAVNNIVSSRVDGSLKLLSNDRHEILTDVRQSRTRVNKSRHGEGFTLRIDDRSLAGLRNADGGHVDPISSVTLLVP